MYTQKTCILFKHKMKRDVQTYKNRMQFLKVFHKIAISIYIHTDYNKF